MALETKEQVDKTIAAIKGLKETLIKRNAIEQTLQQKMVELKNASGATGGDVAKVLEEATSILGTAVLSGLLSE